MSYRYYPIPIDRIVTAYTNGQLYIDTAYIRFSNNTIVTATATITSVTKYTGTDYTDLIVDVKFQFNSSGGTITGATVIMYYPVSNYYDYLELCTNPVVSVSAGSVTLNQRYIIRFYTVS